MKDKDEKLEKARVLIDKLCPKNIVTKQQMKAYITSFKEELEKNLGSGINLYSYMVKPISKGTVVNNADKTGDDDPWGSIGSWINYWRAFASLDEDGEFRQLAEIPPICPGDEPENRDTPQKLLHICNNGDESTLEGAHVYLPKDNSDERPREMYIIPLCHNCNLGDKKVVINADVKMVKVVYPNKIGTKKPTANN